MWAAGRGLRETGDAGCVLGKVVIQLGWKMGSYQTAVDVKTGEWFRAEVTAQSFGMRRVFAGLNPCVILDCVLSLFKTQFPYL